MPASIARSLLTSIVCILATISATYAQSQAIDIPFSAAAGDRFLVTISRETKKLANGKLNSHVIHKSTYEGRINKVSDSGYVLQWNGKTSNITIVEDATGQEKVSAEAVRHLEAAFKGVPLIFETDATGFPTRIVGWDALSKRLALELRKSLRPALEKAVRSTDNKISKEQSKKIIDASIEQVIQSLILRHNGESATGLLEEAGLIASIQHKSLPLQEPTKFTSTTTSAFGPEPIELETILELSRYDEAAGFAEVKCKASFNQEQLKTAVSATLLEQLGASLSAVPDQAKREEAMRQMQDKLAAGTIEKLESASGTVDLNTGWARNARLLKSATMSIPGEETSTEETTVSVSIERQKKR